MLDVLEYGLDRATDPNENKVNQVRQHSFTAGFVWEDPDNVPGMVFFGGNVGCASQPGHDSQMCQKLKLSHCPGCGALKIGFGSFFWLCQLP